MKGPDCYLSVCEGSVDLDPFKAEGPASCLCIALHNLKDRRVLFRGAAGKLERIRDECVFILQCFLKKIPLRTS